MIYLIGRSVATVWDMMAKSSDRIPIGYMSDVIDWKSLITEGWDGTGATQWRVMQNQNLPIEDRLLKDRLGMMGGTKTEIVSKSSRWWSLKIQSLCYSDQKEQILLPLHCIWLRNFITRNALWNSCNKFLWTNYRKHIASCSLSPHSRFTFFNDVFTPSIIFRKIEYRLDNYCEAFSHRHLIRQKQWPFTWQNGYKSLPRKP